MTFVNVMLDADTAINNSSQKMGGSNAYSDAHPKKVGGSGPRKTHWIYAPDCNIMFHLTQYTISMFVDVILVAGIQWACVCETALDAGAFNAC